LWQYYKTNQPGKVVVVGADIWNGSPGGLASFQTATGVTFPLLLNAGTATGGNLVTAYFDRDNYVIIDQKGIERFSARQQGYSYDAALDVPRMKALIDSLLTHPTGVGDPEPPAASASLVTMPNPFRDHIRIDAAFSGHSGAAMCPTCRTNADVEFTVLDLSGREIATLGTRVAILGSVSTTWDGRDSNGQPMPSGVYLVRATSGAKQVTRRVVLLR
jgi:FlgD Ig-like domain